MTRMRRTPFTRELLHLTNASNMDDIQALFKDAIAEFTKNGLEAELDD